MGREEQRNGHEVNEMCAVLSGFLSRSRVMPTRWQSAGPGRKEQWSRSRTVAAVEPTLIAGYWLGFILSVYLNETFGCDYLFLTELAILNAALVFKSLPTHTCWQQRPPQGKFRKRASAAVWHRVIYSAMINPLAHTAFRHLVSLFWVCACLAPTKHFSFSLSFIFICSALSCSQLEFRKIYPLGILWVSGAVT